MRERLVCWVLGLSVGAWIGGASASPSPPTLLQWVLLVVLAIGSILSVQLNGQEEQEEKERG